MAYHPTTYRTTVSNDARFSTYSGAPSLQPSLAPTFESQPTSNRSSHTQSLYSPNMTSQQQQQQQQTQQQRSSINANLLSQSEKNQPTSMNSNPFYNNSSLGAQTSSSTLASTDSKMQDIKAWSEGFERMHDARLDKQRYVMSANKSEEVGKVALGAKVERALGRRMTGQDAIFTKKAAGEKQLEVKVQ